MKLTSSIPVLRGSNYSNSRDFFLSLGFEIIEEAGDPDPGFGIFRREKATVFVDCWHGPDSEPAPCWRAYFHTDDIASIARYLTEKNIDHKGPVDTFYGMREVEVSDPDGNRLCFGQDID